MSLDDVIAKFIFLYKTLYKRNLRHSGEYIYEGDVIVTHVSSLSHLTKGSDEELFQYVKAQENCKKYDKYLTDKDLFTKSLVTVLTKSTNNIAVSRSYYDYFNELLKLSVDDYYLGVTAEVLANLKMTPEEAFEIGIKNAVNSEMECLAQDDSIIVTLDNQCSATLILLHDMYNYWSTFVGENYLCMVPSRNMFIVMRDDPILYEDKRKRMLKDYLSKMYTDGAYPVSDKIFRCVRDGFFPEDALQLAE